MVKGVIAIYRIHETKGYVHKGANFGSLWSQKLKIAFHKFLLIGLLEECLKYKISAFI